MGERWRRPAAVLLALGGLLLVFLNPGGGPASSLEGRIASLALGFGVSLLGVSVLAFSVLIWQERERAALQVIRRTTRAGGAAYLMSGLRPRKREKSWGEALRSAKLFALLSICLAGPTLLSTTMGWWFWYDVALLMVCGGATVYFSFEVRLGIDLYRKTPLT